MDKRTLLVVDDSADDVERLRWALDRVGFAGRLRQVGKVDDAIAVLLPTEPAGRPSLVLLDLDLPDGSGQDVLIALRDNPRGLAPPVAPPVVVVTTSTNPRDVEDCYRLGASGYLVKPLDRELFAERIQALVNYWLSAVCLTPETVSL